MTERVVSVTEARAHFGELLRRVVENHETVVVERGGRPQAVVLSLAEYDRLRGQPTPPEPWQEQLARVHERIRQERQDWREAVRRSRERMRTALHGRPLPAIDDLIAEMREERDEQLLDGLR